MHRTTRFYLLMIVLAPAWACRIEQLETIFEEHGLTYDTTVASEGDTTVGDSTTGSSSGGSTAAAASTDGAEAGHDGSGFGSTSTTGAATTTDESTGGPQPVCGNGVLEHFGWVPEECDDGNLLPGDGCGDSCNADRIMFVTSERYAGGYMQSLYLADALCAQAAKDAGFVNWLKFRAWLSDSQTDARDRFKFSRGRIYLVNGLVVADSWIDLLAGKLKNPIEVTEKSETYQGDVWTGTDPVGVAVPGSMHCEDWTSISGKKTGHYGLSYQITAEWTMSANWDNPQPCSSNNALYCLEER